jgi:hypothetical protein
VTIPEAVQLAEGAGFRLGEKGRGVRSFDRLRTRLDMGEPIKIMDRSAALTTTLGA